MLALRKFLFIAAIALPFTTAASAGPSRSLSLASGEDQSSIEQPKTQTADAPAPTVEGPKMTRDSADMCRFLGFAAASVGFSARGATCYELYRRGIYW